MKQHDESNGLALKKILGMPYFCSNCPDRWRDNWFGEVRCPRCSYEAFSLYPNFGRRLLWAAFVVVLVGLVCLPEVLSLFGWKR
jgi:hypothetical protein